MLSEIEGIVMLCTHLPSLHIVAPMCGSSLIHHQYYNPDVDKISKGLRSTDDEKKQIELCHKFQRIVCIGS